MALRKQAKTLSKHQQHSIITFLNQTRHPDRNRLIFMLSVKAGLRAKEIANLTWSMITDAEGCISDCIKLEDKASKGNSGGVIWLNDDLKQELDHYRTLCKFVQSYDRIIKTERDKNANAQYIVNLFYVWYRKLGYDGCSSHSGRRTFITNAAKKISSVGGSIRDVQTLARHSSLSITQRYIENDVEAQRKIVNLV